jgi:hypothetical protein
MISHPARKSWAGLAIKQFAAHGGQLVHLVCLILAYPVACQVIENARSDLGWLKVGQ